MTKTQFNSKESATIVCDKQTILCQGSWITQTITQLADTYQQLTMSTDSDVTIDIRSVEDIDTAGLWMLAKVVQYIKSLGCEIKLIGLEDEQNEILEKILQSKNQEAPVKPVYPFLERVGVNAIASWELVISFIAFLGEITLSLFAWVKDIRKIRWQSILSNIDSAGLQASGIIALLSFLIGLVLAYQVGTQLETYGASIYVVDLLGLSLLREFSPLLTAIIVAGRSGSAFAAQIGTMKLNEEVDALKTLGVSPTEVLVLPKILGLCIALPLLTILAICFSLLGGIVMSKMMLGISPVDFLKRFSDVIHLKTLILGEIKTPIFALLIASVGCFQGFLVTNSAASVGERTTISVVHSIFMIIVMDALFSIVYSALGI